MKVIKKETFEKKLSLEERIGTLSEDVEPATVAPSAKVLSRGEHLVQEEAQKILSDAKRRAVAVRDEAKRLLDSVATHVEEEKKSGYEVGYQEGLAEVTERLTAVSKLEDQFLKDVEPQMVRLVFDIADKLVGRELQNNRTAVVDRVKGALRELSGAHLVVRVNPADLETIKAHHSELATVVDSMATLLFKEDESVAAGDCIIESEIGVVEARLAPQLLAIKKALGIE